MFARHHQHQHFAHRRRRSARDPVPRLPESAVVRTSPIVGVLSRARLIAEPWDLGDGGYQVGGFPVLWSEWNGRYRDTVRSFWRGEARVIADLGYRLTG